MKRPLFNLVFTLHALGRCTERTCKTGVELTNLANRIMKRKDLLHEKPTHVWLKNTGIRLTMIQNKVITVWNAKKIN